MGFMTIVGGATPQRITSTTPDEWLEDAAWHRRMYNQSHFRWLPEDAMKVATQYTRGRVLFETPEQLNTLQVQLKRLRDWNSQIRDATAQRLMIVQNAMTKEEWGSALTIMGLSEREVRAIESGVLDELVDSEYANTDVKRALRGFPYTNPLTQVWELRQMEGMHQAADDLLEDTLCDLVGELQPQHGWSYLATLTMDGGPRQLKERVRCQRVKRGELGDDRRLPRQTYTPR